jgi:hypothetical protein
MKSDFLFNGLAYPTSAVRRLALYRNDGRFRLIVNELIDRERVDAVSRDDLVLYIGYLFGVIADLHDHPDGGGNFVH